MTNAVYSPPAVLAQGCQKPGSLQIVSFCLGDERYGIEITKVQEVVLLSEITRVPQTPAYVKGLINLRSNVIPVIDLRLRFGMTAGATDSDTRIMVVNTVGKMIGLIVDSVSEVLRVPRDAVASPPPTVTGLGQKYIAGLVTLEEYLLILLDIDNVLDEENAGDVPESINLPH